MVVEQAKQAEEGTQTAIDWRDPFDPNERPFWRKEPPVLRDGRIVKGGMWPVQRRWWELENFIKALVTGFGSGKTRILAARAIALALENEPCPVGTVSPSFPMARHTIIPAIESLLEGKRHLYRGALWYRYYKNTHHFHIRFKHRDAYIHCYSADDPNSLRGMNLAAAVIDEPFIQPEEVFRQMVARVRHPDARRREICLAGTPEELNWGYELCEGDLSKKHDVGVVQGSTRENLLLVEQGYVDQLEASYDGRSGDAYIEGQFVNLAGGRVYHAFSRTDNVVSMRQPPGAELGVGMDFNVDPMAITLFWTHRGHIHIFRECEFPNADTEYVAGWARENYPTLSEVYPDASGRARHTNAPAGRTDYWYLRQQGFSVNAKADNPPRRDRYNAVNGKLRSKSGQVSMTVDPDCKRLIRYFMSYTHERMNTPDHKRMSHLLDAMSYPVAYLFPVIRGFRKIAVSGQ